MYPYGPLQNDNEFRLEDSPYFYSDHCLRIDTDRTGFPFFSERRYKLHVGISLIKIQQIFSLARDWSKHVTWPNISQLKLNWGISSRYSPIFKTARVAKNSLRIINTIASIWHENILAYLSSKLIVFRERNCSLLGTDNDRGQTSEHIFAPNGDYCLYIPICSKYLVNL